jgi:hypothetical protein
LRDWPDWRGQACAIIASGPSTKRAGVELLKDRLPVIAIKRNVELAPWADIVYGCDYPWWRSVRGLPDYHGIKASWSVKACDQWGLKRVEIPDIRGDALLFDKAGTVGAGGNSGFQALNLALQFGADRVLLVGFDMQGEHWYGRNTAMGMNNPTDSNFRRWRAALTGAAPVLAERGVEVVNASPVSDVKSFRRQGVAETLAEWGLACAEASTSDGTREKLTPTLSR